MHDGGARAGEIQVSEMVLTFLKGPYRGREFAFGSDVVSLGKAPQNDIPLSDGTVSRRHAEIRREGRGCLLVDLGSTNGTFLDGSEIREAFLRSGSVVTLGKTRFRFRLVTRKLTVSLPEPGQDWGGLSAVSAEMRIALGRASVVAPLADLIVCLQGEPGSGRRRLAEAIHAASPLSGAPLVWVDCGSSDSATMEKSLFEPRVGLLERSAGGTLVLLEPWDTPIDLQPQLLDAIRRRRGMATASLGPHRDLHPQRFLAVSSRDLAGERDRGHLLPDLCELLGRVRVVVPALRDRTEDLGGLLQEFLREQGMGRVLAAGITKGLVPLAKTLPWPGNVAELRSVLDVLADRFPKGGRRAGQHLLAPPLDPDRSFRENKAAWVASFERIYVGWLMDRHQGNVSRAARAADMDRKHLHRLLARHGLR